jgi:hypothetical protein
MVQVAANGRQIKMKTNPSASSVTRRQNKHRSGKKGTVPRPAKRGTGENALSGIDIA